MDPKQDIDDLNLRLDDQVIAVRNLTDANQAQFDALVQMMRDQKLELDEERLDRRNEHREWEARDET